jgi:hypothetical protein
MDTYMTQESHFNRSARRSGGNRPARFNLPNLTKQDLEILQQEEMVRREFGEEGVKKFWEMIPHKDDKQGE